MLVGSSRDAESVASERFLMLAPLLDDSLEPKAAIHARRAIAKANGISDCTLRRWLANYNAYGFAGLMPKSRDQPRESVSAQDVLFEPALREELSVRMMEDTDYDRTS